MSVQQIPWWKPGGPWGQEAAHADPLCWCCHEKPKRVGAYFCIDCLRHKQMSHQSCAVCWNNRHHCTCEKFSKAEPGEFARQAEKQKINSAI